MARAFLKNLFTGKEVKVYLTNDQYLALSGGEGMENVLTLENLAHAFKPNDYVKWLDNEPRVSLVNESYINQFFAESFGVSLEKTCTTANKTKFYEDLMARVHGFYNVADDLSLRLNGTQTQQLENFLLDFCENCLENIDNRVLNEQIADDFVAIPDAINLLVHINEGVLSQEVKNLSITYNKMINLFENNEEYSAFLEKTGKNWELKPIDVPVSKKSNQIYRK